MACDICGKTGVALVPLRDAYKTEDISDLCPECGKIADEEKNRLARWTSTLLERMLKRNLAERRMMKGKFND